MATILGAIASPFVRKVILAHQYLDVSFELKNLAPGDQSESFQQASPLGKIPAYITDDGFSFSDSSVICAYLDKTVSEKSLLPEQPNAFAFVLWLEEYCDSTLFPATSALFFQKIIGPTFFNHQTDEERVEEVSNELIPNAFDYVESVLKDSEFLVGDRISLADICVVANLVSLIHLNYRLDIERFPKLNSYNEYWINQPIIDALLRSEMRFFQKVMPND